MYMEAYDRLLESWLTLVQDDEHFPRGCFVQPAVQVFNSYIQCHLAAPDGTRNLVSCHYPPPTPPFLSSPSLRSISVSLLPVSLSLCCLSLSSFFEDVN